MIATAVRYNCRESPRVARAVGYLIVLLYNLAAETMGLAKVECVVIEDSAFGLRAGRAAGAWVLTVGRRLKGQGICGYPDCTMSG